MSTLKAVILSLALVLFAYPLCAQTPTLTDVFVSTQNASLGSPVTLTAVVDSISPNGAGISSGTVSFYDCANGQPLATVPVIPASPTNLIPNSDNLAGWTVTYGTINGVPITTAVAPGAQDPTGAYGASHFMIGNEPASWFELTSGLPAGIPGTPYTFSFWMRAVSGALTVEPQITVNNNSVIVEDWLPVTPAWTRYSVTFPSLPKLPTVLDITSDVDVWGLQLEAGSTAGPYVSTSSPRSSSGGGVATATANFGWASGSHAVYAVYSGSSGSPGFQKSTSDMAWVWVNDGTAITVASTVLPLATDTIPYSANLQAVGGQPPYTWSTVLHGTQTDLPGGLQLSSTGVISGTPNAPEVAFSIPVSVVDSVGNTAQATVNMAVDPGPYGCYSSRATIETVTPDSGPVGTSVTITGSGFWANGSLTPQVLFNGVPGIIQRFTSTPNGSSPASSLLVVAVPPNATTGWLSLPQVDNAMTLTPLWFQVLAAPAGSGASCIIADARPRSPLLPVPHSTSDLCRREPESWR